MSDRAVFVDIVTGPIDVCAVRSHVIGRDALGGICTFEGATRADSDADHGRIVRLEYEAYEDMARAQMQRLGDQALDKWGPARIAMVHRIGPVPPSDMSVMIVVACGHRAEAFSACRWLIDMLKRDVPIWKRDVYEDGFERWVDPTKQQQSEER